MDCDGDVCWICLESEAEGNPLKQVCGCPRKVHQPCMARWQLHSAGKK
jgi:E3 ubiquitin-protein ligase DOA10